MNRNKLKSYAPEARRDCIEAVTARAAHHGLTAKKIEPMTEEGDVAIIAGRAFPKEVAEKRKKLEARIRKLGFEQTMEAMAYTWFNRLVAIRFMELHGYLEHGYRVLSHGEGHAQPEIIEHAEHVDLPGLDREKVIELKLDGTKEEELYRMLLTAQCNALHRAMPFLFESIDDETELLLPDHLLHSDSLIRKLAGEIPEEDWQEVEIIGWLYQFYISEKKDEVIGKVVKSEDIPAATQLFTPNWIVRYMLHNTLGRQWLATYPNSPLKGQMEFYIEPADQTPEVQAKLAEITPDRLNPEELTLLDPACGSGHILVEAYDLLKAIYQERGYRAKDIPRLIMEKNLFGLEIDDRAAQLAAFALMMKARRDDRSIFERAVQPQVLSIRDSTGLDAREITESLNQPILKKELPPSGELFEEIADEKSPLFSRKAMGVQGRISQADVACLVDLFEHGKTFGSLIQVPESLAENVPAIAQRVDDVIARGGMFEQTAARLLAPLLQQAQTLAARFWAVVTNPPYMGAKFITPALKTYLRDNYRGCNSDLFSAFIIRNCGLAETNGRLGFMSPFVWMFISTYERLRHCVTTNKSLTTLVQLEYSGFAEATVPICTFTFLNTHVFDYCGSYIRLSDFRGPEEQAARTLEAINNPACGWLYEISHEVFTRLPRTPIAYWISPQLIDLFTSCQSIGDVTPPKIGMRTGDNERFLRRWHEVSLDRVGFRMSSSLEAASSHLKWFPYNKGGDLRKWYGNAEYVVNWENDGQEIKDNTRRVYPQLGDNLGWKISNEQFYFRPSVTWTDIKTREFAARVTFGGFIFDVKGSSMFPAENLMLSTLGLLCSNLMSCFVAILNPTITFQIGDIALVPFKTPELPDARIDRNVEACIAAAKEDWDSSETSWDFAATPLLAHNSQQNGVLAQVYEAWADLCSQRAERMQSLEEDSNRVFAELYGLQDEVPSQVVEDQIYLCRPNEEEDLKKLISYAIGCMMGRYSLDEPGLIYAHSSSQGFDSSKYQQFPADDDGIIPLTDFAWFDDDAAGRFEKFIATAWPADHLEENLKFVAESLGAKKGDSPRATIRRYLAADFFTHHMKTYKKRPIYWLFSSGKQRGFQALVYLHRYNEGTLSRMRTEYVIPLLGKMIARIDHLTDDIASATSSQHRKRLEKEKSTLTKQLAGVQAYDEKLRHYADQRISLDLDDGVKVNYGKFGDLLAEVKTVTGKKP